MKFTALKNGTLLELLMEANKHKIHLSTNTKLYLAWKAFEACMHMWCVNRVLHNDLKPDNILLSDCLEFLVLCDFGHASKIYAILGWKVGTPQYRAPEINQLRDDQFFNASHAEVFAFGTLLFTIMFQKLPFEKMACDGDSLYELVKTG